MHKGTALEVHLPQQAVLGYLGNRVRRSQVATPEDCLLYGEWGVGQASAAVTLRLGIELTMPKYSEQTTANSIGVAPFYPERWPVLR